jgi:hypothetical protein
MRIFLLEVSSGFFAPRQSPLCASNSQPKAVLLFPTHLSRRSVAGVDLSLLAPAGRSTQRECRGFHRLRDIVQLIGQTEGLGFLLRREGTSSSFGHEENGQPFGLAHVYTFFGGGGQPLVKGS